MSFDVGIWIAALLTIGIFSFLYKDNPVYKLCEAIFVGVSAGYWAVTLFWDNIHKILYEGLFPSDNSDPKSYLWIGGILGVLMLMRLAPKIGWISRWPLAFIVGATAGLYMMLYFVSNAMLQIESTIKIPRIGETDAILWSDVPGALIIAIGVVSGLVYFFFSKEHRGAFGVTARLGIWFLMITFGASFGYTVMSRMSLLIGRMDFLLGTWLGLLH